jgi:hypothetical protein
LGVDFVFGGLVVGDCFCGYGCCYLGGGFAVEGGEESEQEYRLESAGAGVMTVLERWVVGMTFLSLFASSRTPVAVFRGLTAEFSATLVLVLVSLSSSSAHSSLNNKNQNWSFSTRT